MTSCRQNKHSRIPREHHWNFCQYPFKSHHTTIKTIPLASHCQQSTKLWLQQSAVRKTQQNNCNEHDAWQSIKTRRRCNKNRFKIVSGMLPSRRWLLNWFDFGGNWSGSKRGMILRRWIALNCQNYHVRGSIHSATGTARRPRSVRTLLNAAGHTKHNHTHSLARMNKRIHEHIHIHTVSILLYMQHTHVLRYVLIRVRTSRLYAHA